MRKFTKLFGATLSTLLFSGVAFSHGVQNQASGDVLTGHSSDHKDAVLLNPSKSMPATTGTNEQDKEDLINRITVHNEELKSSPSSSPDTQHHASSDDAPNIIHEVVDH